MSYTHRVRILPLGDSLTQGDGNPSAYRYDLYRLLAADGIPFRFVGGVWGGDWRLPPDCRYHSGRGGITSNGLIAYHTESSEYYIPSWVEAVRKAEVILLCIGANDIHRGLPVEEYTERLNRLLDLLYRHNPAISTVYIATMRTAWSTNEKLRTMNAALLDPTFAAASAVKGRDVRVENTEQSILGADTVVTLAVAALFALVALALGKQRYYIYQEEKMARS